MRVKFGPWTPDQPDLDSGGLEECVNCLPIDSGYGALRGLQTLSGSVSCPRVVASLMVPALDFSITASRGAYLFVGISGGTNGTQLGRFFYPQNATDNSLTFSNVSRTASYSASLGLNIWSLTRFGSSVYAVNGVDPMQVGSITANFRDQSASASAPIATLIATVRDFVFAGNIVSGGAGAGSNRLQWCQINNPQRWGASPRLQSDFQDLPDSGEILAMTGGDFLTVLTERSVWRGTYVGSPVIFRFDEVAPNIHCLAPATAARYQNLTFFLAKNGFQMFDGQQCIPIGVGSVDKHALNLVSTFNSRSPHLRGVIDPINQFYVVTLREHVEGGQNPDTISWLAIYSIRGQRWAIVNLGDNTVSQVNQITESIMMAAGRPTASTSGGVPNRHSYDKRLGIGVFVDPSEVPGGTPIMSIYNEFISTAYMTATFATGEAQLFPDRRGFVTGVRPLIQGNSSTSITVEVGKRNKLNESASYGAAVSVNSNGLAPLRADARYHRVRVNVSGGFERAVGFDLDAKPAGQR